jgi:hypothetical protein
VDYRSAGWRHDSGPKPLIQPGLIVATSEQAGCSENLAFRPRSVLASIEALVPDSPAPSSGRGRTRPELALFQVPWWHSLAVRHTEAR